MRTALVLVLVLVSAICAEQYGQAGKLLGRPIYWAVNNPRLDTVGWDRIERELAGFDSTDRRGPTEAAAMFADSGKAMYRVKDPSAVGAALLHDAGCRLVVLTQWNATPSTRFATVGSGSSSDEYKKQHGISEYLWELVERTEIAKPGRLGEGFGVTLHFVSGGYATWQSGDELCKRTAPMVTPTDALNIKFIGGSEMPLEFSRRVFAAYAVAPADRLPRKIAADIDAMMDKMKLDLTYKAPVLLEIKQ